MEMNLRSTLFSVRLCVGPILLSLQLAGRSSFPGACGSDVDIETAI